MNPPSEYCVVLTTTDSAEIASQLANILLESKLAACVQMQQINSHYVWNGETCKADEVLLQIKTRSVLFGQVCGLILANHNYQTPEIIQLPITAGFTGYLNWIDAMTGG